MTEKIGTPFDCMTNKVLMAVHFRKRHVVTELQALTEELETLRGLTHRIRSMDPQEALQALEVVTGGYPLGEQQMEPPGASWRVLAPLDLDLSTV